jgi:hypothetical protein
MKTNHLTVSLKHRTIVITGEEGLEIIRAFN